MTQYGVIASTGARPDGPGFMTDLGVNWVRLNGKLDGTDVPFTQQWLQAGFNLVFTVTYRVPGNCDETYITLAASPTSMGFPYIVEATFKTQLTNYLNTYVMPFITFPNQKVIIQFENEVSDITLAPNDKYWGGTTAQYVTCLTAFGAAVHALGLEVATTSFTSNALTQLVRPHVPNHDYQVARVAQILANLADYDYVDLHFYGCELTAAGDVTVLGKTNNFRIYMPDPSKPIISTENSGPNPGCTREYVDWHTDLPGFEAAEAAQVTGRLQGATDAGIVVAMWFSLFDLNGEVDDFNHLGLIASAGFPAFRLKPAYYAFKQYVFDQIPLPTPDFSGTNIHGTGTMKLCC